jgi:hypothetical protein
LLDGVQIRGVGGKKDEFAVWKNIEYNIGVASNNTVHTSFVFNKRAHGFRMVNVAVVQNKDAPGTWVRIGKGNLVYITLDKCFESKRVKKTYH